MGGGSPEFDFSGCRVEGQEEGELLGSYPGFAVLRIWRRWWRSCCEC